MALNEKNLGTRGVDTHLGLANPTAHGKRADALAADYAKHPSTKQKHAGAGTGHQSASSRQARHAMREAAGVIEGRPGIIESTNIDPLCKSTRV
ncbi:hypothetical protein HETIRDRAFT_379364 [Heterobasidion irregulare TC 32-1]|uniref:Uncharacterized protein n=1 Tax=Heterobasidion irregulare (strain TC 32-1) TaxID=747525 RepID=W4KIA1_HETIT|nr:uncharacterized protein HETIRDRAFT_379364 [Heterobasidion irregulare TC 32-1]ETW85429.1 hypothetical protein HETIRDRAFT_379364 [Heterobasidion irregulare TC 32-1]